MVFVAYIFTKPQENQRRILGIQMLDLQLPKQQPSHIDSVSSIMTGFVIAANAANYFSLLGKRSKQLHASRQFLHRGKIRVRIAQAGL